MNQKHWQIILIRHWIIKTHLLNCKWFILYPTWNELTIVTVFYKLKAYETFSNIPQKYHINSTNRIKINLQSINSDCDLIQVHIEVHIEKVCGPQTRIPLSFLSLSDIAIL